MTSLPIIPNRSKLSHSSTRTASLHRSVHHAPSPNPYSYLQQQTRRAVADHRYLYLDFHQPGDQLLSVSDIPGQQRIHKSAVSKQSSEDSEDEEQERDNSFVEATDINSFLEESHLISEKRNRWKRMARARETGISFHKIDEKINPDGLQEYLQKKRNDDLWRKISLRQNKLYSVLESARQQVSSQEKAIVQPKILKKRQHYQAEYKKKVQLKALGRLNKLLHQ